MVRLRLLALFAVTTLAPAVACDNDPLPEAPEPSFAFGSASKRIGPEGGELVGTIENRFPGVKIVIPPGALAKAEDVSFAGALDATPLPPTAERVGPQIRVLPEGLVLAKPARLTLPMDRELRAAFEDPPEGCKVWTRSGQGWSRVEPVATTADSVTIETTSFTTSAAGVILVTKLAVCTDSTCAIPRAESGACTGPIGFCLTSVPDPPTPLQAGTTSSVHVGRIGTSTFLFYLELDNGLLTPIRYDLETSATFRYSRHTPQLGGPIRFSRVQPFEDGTVWAMVGGYGFIRFTPGSGSSAFDTTLEPEALVIAKRGDSTPETVLRFSSLPIPGAPIRRFYVRGAERTARKLFDALYTESLEALPRLPGTRWDNNTVSGAGLFLASTQKRLCIGNYILRPDGTDGTTCDPLFEGFGPEAIAPIESDVPRPAYIASSDRTLPEVGAVATQIFQKFDSNHYAVATPASSATKQVLTSTTGAAGRKTTLPYGASAMAFDDVNSLYVVNTSRPEVTVVNVSTGATRTLRLTTAAEGTPEYTAMIPRKILQIPRKDELLLLVRGQADGTKKLFRLRKAS